LFDTHEILSNAVLIDVTKSLPSLNGEFQKDGSYALNWNSINWADDGYQLYYEEKVVDGDETEFINVPIENRIYNKTINSDSISNVEDSDYRNKYVRIVAIDGHLKAFSNAVLVNDPTISGSFEGILAEEEVNLRIGNRINAIYTFDVYKEMKQPYIKIELNGSKYLKFDGITAELLAVGKTSSEIIPLRLVTEVDSTNGVTIVYAHVLNEKQALESKADEKYRLSLSADVVVNEKNQVEVYDALRRHDETLKNWSLPYNIGDLNVEGVSLDDDMYIRYQAYWNIDDTVSENDQRHTSIEFFRTDVKVKNKKQLPGSM